MYSPLLHYCKKCVMRGKNNKMKYILRKVKRERVQSLYNVFESNL